jgi:hypothetical protein
MNEVSEAAKAKAQASTPHAKFHALATSRTRKAMKSIRLLAGMGRSTAYEYTEAEAGKIIAALEGEITVLKRTLNEPGLQTDIEFDL